MNVVFAGECGTGKSSLINLIIGRDIAKTSNDTAACTTEVRSYKASFDGCNLQLWDTPGLNEGSTTRSSTRSTALLVKSLLRLQHHGEIRLLVYCMQGSRAKAAHLKHYETIRGLLSPTVPIVAVITRLERYQSNMEEWWSNNAQGLGSLGMHFSDHACITTIPDCHELFRERLVYSQRAVRDMIRRNCPVRPPVEFPAASIPEPSIRRRKDSENIGSRTVNAHTTSRRVRATTRLRRISTPLLT